MDSKTSALRQRQADGGTSRTSPKSLKRPSVAVGGFGDVESAVPPPRTSPPKGSPKGASSNGADAPWVEGSMHVKVGWGGGWGLGGGGSDRLKPAQHHPHTPTLHSHSYSHPHPRQARTRALHERGLYRQRAGRPVFTSVQGNRFRTGECEEKVSTRSQVNVCMRTTPASLVCINQQ